MKKKKKDFLFLLQFFYPEYISSATLPYDTALRLAEEGFTVDAFCGYPYEYVDKTDVPRKETVNSINIRRVKYLQMNKRKHLGRIVNFLSLTIGMLFHIFSMKGYKTIISYSNPPVLPLIAVLASKLFKSKLVFVAYDLYPEIAIKTNTFSENSIITKFMNFINKCVYSQADAVVCLSSEMKEFISENRNISSDKVHVIPNWYKDEYQTNRDIQRNAFQSVVNERFVVGYFGNMGVAQDLEIIKDAIRFYKDDPEVCFILSGHGSKHPEFERMLDDEKIKNVYLYGFLKDKDYLDALCISNCAIVSLEKGLTGLCVPSKTYGLMMQGLPIIAVMDESDIVKDICDGAGYHIPDNSSEKLIELIAQLKNFPEDCKNKGIKCREIYCKNYTPDICLNKYVQLLSNL